MKKLIEKLESQAGIYRNHAKNEAANLGSPAMALKFNTQAEGIDRAIQIVKEHASENG